MGLTVWEDASAGLVPNTKRRLRRGEKGQFDEGLGRTECAFPVWECSFHPEALWLVLRSLSRESFNTHRFSFQKGHEKRLYNSDIEPHPAYSLKDRPHGGSVPNATLKSEESNSHTPSRDCQRIHTRTVM